MRIGMGQRANLLIVEAGRRTLYYDHWCANRLDEELFWGPEEALHFIRQLESSSSEDEWLDERWCEGAAVVDVDRHILLFFGGEDILYDARERRVLLDLLRRQWDGWEVRWAPEGIMSIADYFDLPRSQFAAEGMPVPSPFIARASGGLLVTELQHGVLRLGRAEGRHPSLELGPAALDGVRWHREAAFDYFPRGGIHLDRDARRLMTWWAADSSDTRNRLAAGWQGWTVDWHFDDYDPHLALCGAALTLPPFDLAASQRTLLDRLEPHLEDAPPWNPARDANLGENVEINEWTDQSRGREHGERKRAILAELRKTGGL